MPLSPPEPSCLPVCLRLEGALAVVIGDGDTGAAQTRLLHGTGARIRVLARHPSDDLGGAAADAELIGRSAAPDDVRGARLCIVALEDDDEAARAVAMAREAGALVNAAGRTELCDFVVPPVVRRDPVTIPTGTGRGAPALGRYLRDRIEHVVPPGIGILAALCRDWRARVLNAVPTRDSRRSFSDAVMQDPELVADRAGNRPAAEATRADRLAAAPVGVHTAPRGRATLVGAGPGDPELLTRRAVAALKAAEVILSDALVDPAVLGPPAAPAGPGARLYRLPRSHSPRPPSRPSAWPYSAGTVRRAFRAAGAHLLFLPDDSPGLNPIEILLAKLNVPLRRRRAAHRLTHQRIQPSPMCQLCRGRRLRRDCLATAPV